MNADSPFPSAAGNLPVFAGEGFLEHLLEDSGLLVSVKDARLRYLGMSAAMERQLDLGPGRALGRTVFEVLPREAAERFHRLDSEVLQTGRATQDEERFDIAGMTRTFIATRLPLTDHDGRVRGVCTISTDITDRKGIEQALRNVALGVSAVSGREVFRQTVRYLARTLGVDVAFLSVVDEEQPETLRMLAVQVDGHLQPNFHYPLKGTPCIHVLGKSFTFIPDGLVEQFDDDMATELGLASYAGYPLFDSAGKAMGVLAVGHRRPMADRQLIEAVLRIFAVRAGAELERQWADRARAVSEASYREIFEATEDAVFIHDFDTGAIVDVNPKACEMYGYTRDEFPKLDIGVLSSGVPPYTTEHAAELIARAKAGRVVRTEWHRRNRDGTLHWDELVLKRATLGGRRRVLAFTREITERREAEAALKAREEQYRAIFDNAVDGLLVLNREGRVADANPAFCRMHGYTRRELLRMDPRTFIEPGHWEQFESFLDSLSTGKPFRCEARDLHKDGTVFDVEVTGVRLAFQGEAHLMAIVRDVTQRKEQEAALRKSEDRLRATVESALDSIVGMDADGHIVGFNPAAEACFGYRREEVLGRPLAEVLIPERDRDRHRAGLAHYNRTGEGPFLGRRVEVTALRADGSTFPAELAIGVTRGPEGRIFIGYMRDITERRHAETERGRLEAQLRQAQKMEAIGHLTGGIAHDFNNILTGIMGYTVLARERVGDAAPERLAHYLDQIRQAGERARDLIQQMLTFSRGQRGEPRPLDLSRLAAGSVKLFGSTFPSTIEFRTDLSDTLPPVMLDPVQAEQVIMNLCINARDAMPDGGAIEAGTRISEGIAGTCAACRKPIEGAWVELWVRDTGPGIDPDVADRMFEPFFTTKDVGKGTGMGLATVHGIVHDHGGHVLVDSRPGGGATFRVLFPAAEGAVGPGSAESAESELEARPRRTARVLLADDEASVRGFMRELLESRGFTVDTAADGRQALEMIRAGESFELLITDQTMPRLTGLQLAETLGESRRNLPVILYTGHSDSVDPGAARAAGIGAILAKPVDVATLFEAIDGLLEGAECSA